MAKIPRQAPPNSLPEKLQEADCEHWAAKDLWALSEAACLLRGWKPVPEKEIPPGELHGRFLDLRRDMENTANNNDRHKVLFYYYSYGVGPQVFVPWRVIAWADSKLFPVPELLRRAFLRSHPEICSHSEYLREIDRLKQEIATRTMQLEQSKTKMLVDYMNPEHEFFAPELEAAVSAWMELFGQKRIDESRGSKEQIESWLQERGDRPLSGGDPFSEKAIGRIAAVVTPKKKKAGGRPPTENKT